MCSLLIVFYSCTFHFQPLNPNTTPQNRHYCRRSLRRINKQDRNGETLSQVASHTVPEESFNRRRKWKRLHASSTRCFRGDDDDDNGDHHDERQLPENDNIVSITFATQKVTFRRARAAAPLPPRQDHLTPSASTHFESVAVDSYHSVFQESKKNIETKRKKCLAHLLERAPIVHGRDPSPCVQVGSHRELF